MKGLWWCSNREIIIAGRQAPVTIILIRKTGVASISLCMEDIGVETGIKFTSIWMKKGMFIQKDQDFYIGDKGSR